MDICVTDVDNCHMPTTIITMTTASDESNVGKMESPTPSSTDTATSSTSNSSDSEAESVTNTKCSLCHDTYTIPKVLSCFHTFCQPCLEKILESPDKVACPTCGAQTYLSSVGVAGLLPDFAVSNVLEATAIDSTAALSCTGCKSSDTNAVARCFDCANFLCTHCVMAHKFMHCFEGHRVLSLTELHNTKEDVKVVEKPLYCTKHRSEVLRFFCKTCDVPICKECSLVEHSRGHEYDYLSEVTHREVEALQQLAAKAKSKASEMRTLTKNIEHSSNGLQVHYHKAENEINDTFNFYRSMLEDRKQDALKELDSTYNAKQVALSAMAQRMTESIERLFRGSEFIEKLVRHASTTEVLMFKKTLDSKLQSIMSQTPETNALNAFDIEFVSNYQAIQVGIRNTFGYIRQANGDNGQGGRPSMQQMSSYPNGYSSMMPSSTMAPPLPRSNNMQQSNGGKNYFETSSLLNSKHNFPSNSSLTSFPPPSTDTFLSNGVTTNPYEKWSSGGMGDIFQNGDIFSTSADPMMDITTKLISANIYPPKSQIKRQKMIYHCKFGEFGVMEGQFTEPSGVAVNAQNDIIVADTNNHRIQIFDREGRFKFQFGECGKRDGQLLYPNRVAVVKASGDIVVTERSPTHQVQIYNQYGQFVRKFGANILQHPRGVTVDYKGRIIIVECKVMRVIIFDQMGNVLNKFGCSKHLEFPNGVVVNDKEEIFISDNRAHCVKVFTYQGVFVRQIGGEGVTNYPIGVGINNTGDILIADNHNNFNLTIFTQEGQLINALESKVKHAQCFDVTLMDDGSIVLASKDYRLYIYRYAQLACLGM